MHIHGGDIYTYQNMLDFSANINPLGLPEPVIRAALQGVRRGIAYPDPQCRRLKAALSEHEQVAAEQIICGNGAADLIFGLTLALKPRRALLLAPGFAEYAQALAAVDCRIDYFYLREEQGFRLDLAAYLKALGDRHDPNNKPHKKYDIAFLCSPNNPTGLALPRNELEQILDRCRELATTLVLDECFADFLEEPAAHSLKHRLGDSPNLFILKAFTKIYAMPGLRLGYGLCGNQRLLRRLGQVMQPWRVSSVAEEAGLAALQQGDYVAASRALIQQERDFLLQGLELLGLKVYGAMANFIFFKAPCPDLAERCRRHNLLLRDCCNYEGLTPGFYRVAVRLPEENRRLLEVLALALA